MSASSAYRKLFTLTSITQAYDERIAGFGTRGIDRITPAAFEARRSEHLGVIYKKAHPPSYGFSPYLEGLITKGRDKPPRLISKPTVRDRIVLTLLKDLLHELFPEFVARRLPNAHVRAIRQRLDQSPSVSHLRTDISSFYGSLDHEILEERLARRIRSDPIRGLIMAAVSNPTVPFNYRRRHIERYRPDGGVPQGLAISNVLANIYLDDLDQKIRSVAPGYDRYVDDILVLGSPSEIASAEALIERELAAMKLELNLDKTTRGPDGVPFEFLGYRFSQGAVSVRESSVDRYVESIAARFTQFRERYRERELQAPWLNADGLKAVFVEELNIAIAGAVAGGRRYGWIFYYLEITDEGLLHRLDSIITSFFHRSPPFGARPANVRRYARAFFEARHRPTAGYAFNYDVHDTLDKKAKVLHRFGLLDSPTGHGAEEVEKKYDAMSRSHLRRLIQDTARMS